MKEFAQALIATINVAVFIVQPLVTFSVGVATGGPQLRALLAKPGLNLRYFLATFVVMPALAILLGIFGRVPQLLWGGLALMSIAPPAPPATRRLRKIGNFDVGLAWQAEAYILAAVTIPLTIALVQWMGLASPELNVPWREMLERGVLFFAGPMLLGLLVRRYLPAAADAIVKPLGTAADLAFMIFLAMVLLASIPLILRYDVGSIAIITAFVAVSVLVAHLFGGPRRDTRITLAAMLAARFPVPAMLLAQANGATATILPLVFVYIIAGTVLFVLYTRFVGHATEGA